MYARGLSFVYESGREPESEILVRVDYPQMKVNTRMSK